MAIDISKLNATELDALIADAAKRRAALNPPVSMEPSTKEGAMMGFVCSDPRFFVNETPMHGGVLLRIRAPGHGWLGYHLPHHSAMQLADLLRQWSRDPSAAPKARQ
jgi:hypothetical protein